MSICTCRPICHDQHRMRWQGQSGTERQRSSRVHRQAAFVGADINSGLEHGQRAAVWRSRDAAGRRAAGSRCVADALVNIVLLRVVRTLIVMISD